jgi:hypothetical protein
MPRIGKRVKVVMELGSERSHANDASKCGAVVAEGERGGDWKERHLMPKIGKEGRDRDEVSLIARNCDSDEISRRVKKDV